MRDERTARIALACLVEPGTPGLAERVAERGADAVLRELAARARGATLPPGRLWPEEVPDMLAEQERRGIRVLVAGDQEFPSQLGDLAEPPLALWVQGPLDLRMTTLRSIAVVGARACTPYGERATSQISSGLAETGWAVVSGGAFGIDAAAHRAALGVAGPTVAVLAGGVDVVYPRAHDALLCRIADTGAVVSELPPGSQPLRHRFLARNRLIAAVSRGTVVVEAARRSGAIATANRALELGRTVMAVPGPVTAMASAGTNRLLHEQAARAVSDSEEVVALVLEREPAGSARGSGSGYARPGDPAAPMQGSLLEEVPGLPVEMHGVLAVLPRRGGLTLAAVAEAAGVTEAVSLAGLGLLEVAGLATRSRRGWRRCD